MNPVGRLLVSSIFLGGLAAEAAYAQTAPDGVAAPAGNMVVAQNSAAAKSNQIENVVVTAQKRRESIKEIPYSITALGSGQIARNHVVDVEDITRQMPGVSFAAGAGEGRDTITIRGISSQGGNATVGIYLDDAPIQTQLPFNSSYAGATEPRLFDIDRVEVLRGPQGTLYGAGSMGGTIRYIEKQPDLDHNSGFVDSDLGGTVHGGVNYEEAGVANFVLIPGKLALRIGLDYAEQSGWINNYAFIPPTEASALSGLNTSSAGALRKSGTNLTTTLASRAALLYKPNEDLTIETSMFVQRLRSNDTSLYYPDLGTYNQDSLVPQRNKDSLFAPTLTVSDNLGWADVTSVSSYFWRNVSRVLDSTYYNSDFFEYLADFTYPDTAKCGCGVAFESLPSPGYTSQTTANISEELRLASKPYGEGDWPISWVAGLFISDKIYRLSDDEIIPGVAAEFVKLYGVPPQDTGFDDPMTGGAVGLQGGREEEQQYAAFGEASYNILPNLQATVGLRYQLADTSFHYYEGAYFNQGLPPEVNASASYHAATPKFALKYDLNREVTLYANVAEGYRLGGFVLPIQDTPTSLCTPELATLGLSKPSLTYNPDHLWSYEAGTKTTWFDNRLSVNASGYYVDWSQVQQSFFLGCGAIYTANFGTAESYGGELEIKAKPVTGLTLGIEAGATHAVLTQVTPGVGATVGESLLNTPEWTATFTEDYAFAINDRTDGFIHADYDWIGRTHGSFDPTNVDYSRPVYALLNASLGVEMGRYVLSAYAKNMLDNTKIIQHVSINELVSAYSPQPPTFGLNLRVNF